MVGKGLFIATPSGAPIIADKAPVIIHSIHYYASSTTSTSSWFDDSGTGTLRFQLKSSAVGNKSLDFAPYGVVMPGGAYMLCSASDIVTVGYEAYPSQNPDPYVIAQFTANGPLVSSGKDVIVGGIVLTSTSGGASTITAYHGIDNTGPLAFKLTCPASDMAIHMCPNGMRFPNGLYVQVDGNTNRVFVFNRIP